MAPPPVKKEKKRTKSKRKRCVRAYPPKPPLNRRGRKGDRGRKPPARIPHDEETSASASFLTKERPRARRLAELDDDGPRQPRG